MAPFDPTRREFLLYGLLGLGGAFIVGSMGREVLRPYLDEYLGEKEKDALLTKIHKAGLSMHEAMWSKNRGGSVVQCILCPNECVLRPGERGLCRTRINIGGGLKTLVYGLPLSANVDPIEKKPVFHMLPGSTAFSIATAGCVLACKFCQNWQISQASPEDTDNFSLAPADVVAAALRYGSRSVAYTYTEPTAFYEYMLDTAKLVKKAGLKNIMISCGYINPDPLREISEWMDVVKIDLKGFRRRFYKELCGSELDPVLMTLRVLKEKKVLTEVVNLMIPSLNDDPQEISDMIIWIRDTLGPETPLFFSRFHPQFKLLNLPPTPVETLELARKKAMDAGLQYVYIGNVPGHDGENTYCPKCHRLIIQRIGYSIGEVNIRDGACAFCGHPIPGIWS